MVFHYKMHVYRKAHGCLHSEMNYSHVTNTLHHSMHWYKAAHVVVLKFKMYSHGYVY